MIPTLSTLVDISSESRLFTALMRLDIQSYRILRQLTILHSDLEQMSLLVKVTGEVKDLLSGISNQLQTIKSVVNTPILPIEGPRLRVQVVEPLLGIGEISAVPTVVLEIPSKVEE